MERLLERVVFFLRKNSRINTFFWSKTAYLYLIFIENLIVMKSVFSFVKEKSLNTCVLIMS